MNQVETFLFRAFVLTTCLFYSIVINAYDFEVDGLCYNILSNNQVEITYKDKNANHYSGNLVIPEKVIYGGKEYVVSSIGKAAFAFCPALTGSIVIPSSVTSIGDSAFVFCSGLTGTLTIPNSIRKIGNYTFWSCKGLTGLTIPSSVISIGKEAFYACIGLTGPLTIPNSVTSIGYSAFSGCSGLRGTLIIPSSIKEIEDNTFADCSGLTGLMISSSVISIGAFAFFGCSGLTGQLIIPNSVTSIKDSAFRNCTQLKKVTSEIVPPFSISNTAFMLDSGLHDILEVPNGTKNQYQALSGWANYFKEIVEIDVPTTTSVTYSDVNYTVISNENKTVNVARGDYGVTLEIPASFSTQNNNWNVIGIEENALESCQELAAVVWKPEAAFTAKVSNPNLLLYVNDSQYASTSIQNVVVNGTANKIVLTDAASSNNFYCPQEFTAQSIRYTHNYDMTSGLNESRGWETIALPFDVQKVSHSSKGEILPFAQWKSGYLQKPFWLMELTSSGWKEADGIKANTPYIISMPNNQEYKSGFLLNGDVTFSAENATVRKTENLHPAVFEGKTFVPNFVLKEFDIYALNVINELEKNHGDATEGSTFIWNLRPVHPFEAYMTTTQSTRSISISEAMPTAIIGVSEMIKENSVIYYDLQGRRVMRPIKGVYIKNRKKLIIR